LAVFVHVAFVVENLFSLSYAISDISPYFGLKIILAIIKMSTFFDKKANNFLGDDFISLFGFNAVFVGFSGYLFAASRFFPILVM
jgi:hypothetical protein